MTTTRLTRIAVALATLSTACTVAAFVLMFPNDFKVGEISGRRSILVGTVYPLVSVRIISREPRNLVGWFMLLGACCWAIDLVAQQYAWFAFQSAGGLPGAPFAAWLSTWVWPLGSAMFLILMPIFFPDGLLPSRRWGPIVVAVVVVVLATAVGRAIVGWAFRDDVTLLILHQADIQDDPSLAGVVGGVGTAFTFLVGVPLAPIAVISRWRASTGVRRLQIRWFVSGIALTAICVVAQTEGYLTGALDVLVQAVLVVAAVAFPALAIGVAILRYRLYDIDRVVSRTIAYAVVTAALVIVYLVVDLGLTTILSSVAGSGSVAVAASTLVVAALFTPVRRRVQRVVDRRFDRARYDAERTTAAFSERLRNEVDLAAVAADLDQTVRAAIAPTSVNVWLGGRTRASESRNDVRTAAGHDIQTKAATGPRRPHATSQSCSPRRSTRGGIRAVGLIFPGSLGAFFGIQMDATSTALIRLVSASYVGFGVLDWAALDLTDRAGWRAVAVGNTTGWALGGLVMATALASGLGNTIAWSMVAIQVAMTIGWLGVIAWTSRTGASEIPA